MKDLLLRLLAIEDDTQADAPQRFPFFVVACVLAFLAILGFGLYNWVTIGFRSAAPSLVAALIVVGGITSALAVRRKEIVYFVGLLAETAYLMLLIVRVGDLGSLSYWVLLIPLISFFLLGRTLGAIMSLIALLATAALFLLPLSFAIDLQHAFTPTATARFFISYALVAVLSLVYESVRASSAAAARERQAKLEQANEDVTRLSQTDALTGCHNRLFFEDAMATEVRKALRYDTRLALILCDIDHFKSVNDRFGHQAGDKVLVEIGRALDNRVRRGVDWAARWGGEEFAIALPYTDLSGAAMVAERIRQTIESLCVDLDGDTLSVTASFGVAEFEPADGGTDRLYERADRRLYAAKDAGRNVVVSRSASPSC